MPRCHNDRKIFWYIINKMMLDILDKTPGLFSTLVLLVFVIGTMVDSILNVQNDNDATDVKK